MFCYQCQETARNLGCTVRGVCGKSETLANLFDLLIFGLKGLAYASVHLQEKGRYYPEDSIFVMGALFKTITNTNWDEDSIRDTIEQTLALRDKRKKELCDLMGGKCDTCPEAVTFQLKREEYDEFAKKVGVLKTENEDIRSLRETIIYGLKGICAYGEHSAVLGYQDDEVNKFVMKALAATLDDNLTVDQLIQLVLKTGENAVKIMAKLDEANTKTYGSPEPTKVKLGVNNNPGILVSGHDLKDLEELLQQTEGKGVDVYTHGEMLPAHYYPAFKQYKHFIGNYGGSWWHQLEEFESFNGAILMTTNCLVPLRKENTYLDRLFTTGMVNYPNAVHIPEREDGKAKDFTPIIERALKCQPPKEIETGEIIGGFAHDTVLGLADKII
ncbi:MAG: hydroxylamine reductase, partial [Candidatus Cloacimonas sp.]